MVVLDFLRSGLLRGVITRGVSKAGIAAPSAERLEQSLDNAVVNDSYAERRPNARWPRASA